MLTLKFIASGLFIFIFCFQQTAIAQSITKESGMDTYSQFLIVIVLILIATSFIVLLILDKPKYEAAGTIAEKEKSIVAKYSLDLEYKPVLKSIFILKIIFYTAIVLSLIYLLLIILILRVS